MLGAGDVHMLGQMGSPALGCGPAQVVEEAPGIPAFGLAGGHVSAPSSDSLDTLISQVESAVAALRARVEQAETSRDRANRAMADAMEQCETALRRLHVVLDERDNLRDERARLRGHHREIRRHLAEMEDGQ